MPQQLNGLTVDLLQVKKKKLSISGFNRGKGLPENKYCVKPLQPLCPCPPLTLWFLLLCSPAVMTSLCSAEHLQPVHGLRQSVACLCWWHLLPQGPRNMLLFSCEARECELCVFFYHMRGCDGWDWEEHLHIYCCCWVEIIVGPGWLYRFTALLNTDTFTLIWKNKCLLAN